MRAYGGITLNHLDPADPAFKEALRSALNEINKWILSAQRELSPQQGGSVAAEGASIDEPYVVATATSGLNNERTLTGVSPIGVSDGGAGGNISVTLSGTVPVASGGTGATTAAAARTALGVDIIQVNGVDVTDGANFNDTTPSSASGVNVTWQRSGTGPDSVSAYVDAAAHTGTFGSVAGEGTASSVLRSDAQLPIFGGATPEDVLIGGTDDGVGTKAARIDHVHSLVVADPPAITFGDTNADGIGGAAMRGDVSIKSKSSAHWVCSAAGKGLVSKDTQGTPRFWAIYAEKGASDPSGDAILNISSTGVVTATRAGGAAGDITIVIKDLGTTIPF